MIRRFLTWYKHPDQDLLRGETRWALRWLRRREGVVWLLCYLAACVLSTCAPFAMARMVSPRRGGWLAAWYWFSMLGGLPGLVMLGIWVFLIRRRLLAPFGWERAYALRLAPLRGKDLWPALLAAPVIVLGVLAFIRLVVFYLRILFGLFFGGALLSPGQASVSPLVWGLVLGIDPLAEFVAWVIFAAGATAFVALRCVPKAGTGAVVAWILTASAFVVVPAEILGRCLTASGARLYSPEIDMNAIYLHFALASLAKALLSALIALILWRKSLASLRGEKTMDRIRHCAG